MTTGETASHHSNRVVSALAVLGGLGSAAAVVAQVKWIPAIGLVVAGSVLVSLAAGSMVTRVMLGTVRRSGRLKSSVDVAAAYAVAAGLVLLVGSAPNLAPATRAVAPILSPRAPDTSSPTATATPAGSPLPSTAPRATGAGSVLAEYSVDVSNGFGFNIGAGPTPQPFETSTADLAFTGFGHLESSGRLALIDTPIAYATCQADTRYTSRIDDPAPGVNVCFTGHGVVAAIQITQRGSTGSGDYLRLTVTVWRGP